MSWQVLEYNGTLAYLSIQRETLVYHNFVTHCVTNARQLWQGLEDSSNLAYFLTQREKLT